MFKFENHRLNFDGHLEQADLKKLDSEIENNSDYSFLKLPYKDLPERYQNLIAQELNEPDCSSLYDLMDMTRKAFGSHNTLFSTKGNKITGWIGIRPGINGNVENIKMIPFLDSEPDCVVWEGFRILLEILLFDIGYHTVSWSALKTNSEAVKASDMILAMYSVNENFNAEINPMAYTISWKEAPSFDPSKKIADFIDNDYKFKINCLSKEQNDFIKNFGINKFISDYQKSEKL